jgi:uncharacterized protein YfaS (alpha-2-macroglobulin family)
VLSEYQKPPFREICNQFKREKMFAAALKAWQKLSPYGRALLALTLQRSQRTEEARKVLDSILDLAKTTEYEGVFWAPEPKAWLWYQDTVESHAFILQALLEIKPDDPRVDGIALWLLRNKYGNQWKSTKATAEAIAALVAYLHKTDSLEVGGKVKISAPPQSQTFIWQPGEFAGKQRMVLGANQIRPESGILTFEKSGQGYCFVSTVWQYSTEKVPSQGSSNVLAIERKYYLVTTAGREQKLLPLAATTKIKIGDELEVEMTIQAKTPMEYVHLHDPRPAGFEPEEQLSGYHWDQLLGYYEEIRDSGVNFFFSWLPQGTFTFRYRIRAATAGVFLTGPAVLQSMYAPEFGAHSSGQELVIQP